MKICKILYISVSLQRDNVLSVVYNAMCFLRLLTVLCTSKLSFLSDIDVRNPDEKSIMTYIAQFLQYSNDLPIADDEFEVSQTPTESLILVSASAFLPLFILSLFLFLNPLYHIMALQLCFLLLSVASSWLDAASNSALSHLPFSCQPPYIFHSCCAGLTNTQGTGRRRALVNSSTVFLSKYNSSISFYLFQHAFWFSNQSRIRFCVSCPALRLHPVRKSERWNAG